jgi:hypothetical protein
MSTSRSLRFLASLALAVWFCGPFPVLAQSAPPMGVVLEQFSVLGNSGVTGSTGVGTVVDGDVGSSPTASISNFPPSSVNPPFVLHLTNDLTVQQARLDAIAAYNALAAQGPGTVLAAQLDGAVLTSGIYSFAGGAADLAALGTLTLNGPGVFVFQVDSALTANVGSNVIGTADPCSVYWRVGTSATLNGVSFSGNVIAGADITVGSGSNVTGKVIAGTGATGAVTMAGAGGNTIGGCACPIITLDPTTLPSGEVGTPYNEVVSATGGAIPYTYVVSNGSLPPTLSLDPSTGAITGTPTTVGTFVFEITATDVNGCSGSQSYSIVIAATGCPPIVMNPLTLPDGSVGTFYDELVFATGGVEPYTYAVTSGALPTGLELDPATGAITGIPTEVGDFVFVITAIDANGCPGLLSYTVSIAFAPLVTTAIPTLSEWGLAAFAALAALVAILRLRKRTQTLGAS